MGFQEYCVCKQFIEDFVNAIKTDLKSISRQNEKRNWIHFEDKDDKNNYTIILHNLLS